MTIKVVHVFLVIFRVYNIPSPFHALRIKEHNVMNAPVLLAALSGIAMRASSFPNYLGPEIRCSKHSIHQQLQIVAGGGVAVEVDAAGGLEDAVELDHPLGHHGEVGHHVVLAEELAQGGEEAADLVGSASDHVLVGGLGLPAPVPGVLEGGDLGGGFLAGALAEEDVVGGVGVEGRVQVDEVDGFVGDVLAEDVQIVAEVEAVGGFVGGGGGHGRAVPWVRRTCAHVTPTGLGGCLRNDSNGGLRRARFGRPPGYFCIDAPDSQDLIGYGE